MFLSNEIVGQELISFKINFKNAVIESVDYNQLIIEDVEMCIDTGYRLRVHCQPSAATTVDSSTSVNFWVIKWLIKSRRQSDQKNHRKSKS